MIICAIGFGSPEGELAPIRDAEDAKMGHGKDAWDLVLLRPDRAALWKVLSKTGGSQFRVAPADVEIDAVVDSFAALPTGASGAIPGPQRAAPRAAVRCGNPLADAGDSRDVDALAIGVLRTDPALYLIGSGEL